MGTTGEYLPAEASGAKADHVFGFVRRHDEQHAVVAVPRLLAGLVPNERELPLGSDVWHDTVLHLPGVDPNVRWRIAGSSVQRSTNRGASWEVTSTGLATELTAGSAPSVSVCWVVGRGGVVLLSIDGVSWQRVPFPEATDLSAIRARDARSASVSTAAGRTFSTTNAGITWVSGPLQGF